jgi:hypothetical protein
MTQRVAAGMLKYTSFKTSLSECALQKPIREDDAGAVRSTNFVEHL